MPSISSCPECHRDLTIPEIGDPGQSLRCPLCDAEFPAERILADSVSFPPLAIVVGEATAAPIGADEMPPQIHSERPDLFETELPRSKLSDEVAHLPQSADSDLLAAAGDDREIDVTIESEEAEAPSFTADDSELSRSERRSSKSDDEDLGDVAVDTGGASHAVELEEPALRVAAQPRRKASGWGVVGQLFGMVVGGAAGLAIGYWILLWINPRADFLELRGKLPSWMMPAGRRHAPPWQDSSAAEPSGPGAGRRSLADLLREPDAGGPALEVGGPEDFAQPADFSQVDVVDSSDDAQAGDDPLPHEPTPREPIGPRGFSPHTADELKSALAAALRAVRCEYCQGNPRPHRAEPSASDETPSSETPRKTPRCEHCRGTGVGNITVPVFERLCELAEIATFAQFDAADAAARDECRNAAQDLLLLIAADRDRGEVIGRLAADRLDDSQRPSNGVILAGTVARTQHEGDLFTMRIVLSGIARTVTVVSRDAPEPAFGPRDHVLILGSIVDSPANNLAGYEGDQPKVIWGGVPFKLAGAPR